MRLVGRVGGKVAAAGAMAAGALLVAPGTAYACSCVTADAAEFARSADVVVVGTVENRDVRHPSWPLIGSGDPVTYRVAVDRVYKGRVGSVVLVDSASTGASCGIAVSLGERYVVYADRSGPGGLSAGLCGGTTQASPSALAAVERALGAPTPPDPTIAAPEPQSSLLWPVGGIVLVGGAVLAAVLGVCSPPQA